MLKFMPIGWSPYMPHDHDHLSPSGHPYRADQDIPLSYHQTLEIAVRELLIDKGIVTASEVSQTIDAMDKRSPADGARVVARAWVDPAFKARLLSNGSDAIAEMGFDAGAMRLIVIENTPSEHNVVVCTLCSCYPRNLLGLPRDWSKQRAYRSRVVREPRAVLAEFGLSLVDEITVRVHDSTADMRYLILPMRPVGTENMTEDALAALVTRDSMIGVGVAKALGA
jgi:nitrile hydratase